MKVPLGIIKEVQYHPVTSSILHVDLQRVVAGKPIQVDVAIELNGEPEVLSQEELLIIKFTVFLWNVYPKT